MEKLTDIVVTTLLAGVVVGGAVQVIKGYVGKLGKDAEERSKEWREELKKITDCIVSVKVGMEKKVDRRDHELHCKETIDEIWARVNKHGHVFDKEENTVGKVIIDM